MDYKGFIEKSKQVVAQYTNGNMARTSADVTITPEEVYVVWYCKTLQNAKALLSTDIPDGMYYEVTYNGDKDEMYFDAYQKVENIKIEMGQL